MKLINSKICLGPRKTNQTRVKLLQASIKVTLNKIKMPKVPVIRKVELNLNTHRRNQMRMKSRLAKRSLNRSQVLNNNPKSKRRVDTVRLHPLKIK